MLHVGDKGELEVIEYKQSNKKELIVEDEKVSKELARRHSEMIMTKLRKSLISI